MKKIFTAVILGALFCSSMAFSSEKGSIKAFFVDRTFPYKNIAPFYKANDRKKPLLSTFTIQNQVFLSNDLGERVAIVTIINSATNIRILQDKQIMAVFANGDKRIPKIDRVQILAGESMTFVFDFGVHKFPIMYLYTDNL
jgi:hypothetical protein